MDANTFLKLIGILFAIGTMVHLTRIIFHWHLQIGSWVVPTWVSWVGILVGGYLSWTAFHLAK